MRLCVGLAFADGVLGHVGSLGVHEKGHFGRSCRQDGAKGLAHAHLILLPLPREEDKVEQAHKIA